MRADVDAARGEEAGAALEQVERRRRASSLASRASARSSAAASSGSPLMARKLLDQRARLARQPGAGAERRLLEEAVGDLADRAAADRGDAGDRQEIGDQRVRALRIGAGERGQHALIFRPRHWRRRALSRSRSCASLALRLKSLISRRFQAGARSSAAISAANSPTSPMRMSGAATP